MKRPSRRPLPRSNEVARAKTQTYYERGIQPSRYADTLAILSFDPRLEKIMEGYWLVQSEDEPSSVWIVIAPTKSDAIEKFCKKTSFPKSDFQDGALTIKEETPIC